VFEDGESILNINTKQTMSIDKFMNEINQPDGITDTPHSTVNLINIKELSGKTLIGFENDAPEALSTIRPKSRSAKDKMNMSINSSDAEISKLFASNKENKENERFDIYNQMMMFNNSSPRVTYPHIPQNETKHKCKKAFTKPKNDELNQLTSKIESLKLENGRLAQELSNSATTIEK
jgi:hypothetical protein